MRYVKYVLDRGALLHQPISTGQREFLAGIVYEIENLADLERLTFGSNPAFVECTADGSPVTKPQDPVPGEGATSLKVWSPPKKEVKPADEIVDQPDETKAD